MTYLVSDWQRPISVQVLQTTAKHAEIESFDIHPDNPTASKNLTTLEKDFTMPHSIKFMKQVHGDAVLELTEPQDRHFKHQADACFTRLPGVVCAVMTADCLPVMLTNTKGDFVAAIHCGWRSLFAGIIGKTIKQINPAHEILAWLGPCIQVGDYEVGGVFKDHYLSAHPNATSGFAAGTSGHVHANLQQLAILQLQALGVDQITCDPISTHSNTDYHSWRRNQTAKRMATLIWRTPAHD